MTAEQRAWFEGAAPFRQADARRRAQFGVDEAAACRERAVQARQGWRRWFCRSAADAWNLAAVAWDLYTQSEKRAVTFWEAVAEGEEETDETRGPA